MTAFFESQLKDLKGGKCSVNMNFILLKISYRKLEPAVSPPTFRHKWNKGSSQALCVTHCSSGLQLWNLTPRRLSVRPQPKTSHLCTGRMDGLPSLPFTTPGPSLCGTAWSYCVPWETAAQHFSDFRKLVDKGSDISAAPTDVTLFVQMILTKCCWKSHQCGVGTFVGISDQCCIFLTPLDKRRQSKAFPLHSISFKSLNISSLLIHSCWILRFCEFLMVICSLKSQAVLTGPWCQLVIPCSQRGQ